MVGYRQHVQAHDGLLQGDAGAERVGLVLLVGDRDQRAGAPQVGRGAAAVERRRRPLRPATTNTLEPLI